MVSQSVEQGGRARCALVTGGTTGIGRATALALAREGYRVAVNGPARDADAAAAEEAVRELSPQSALVVADLASVEGARALVAATVEQFDGVDALVLNAGICPLADLQAIDEALWDAVHAVNLRSAFFVAQGITAHMIETGTKGAIVGVSSVSARLGAPRQLHYSPTKSGLISLIQGLAVSLGPHGIRANVVLPGAIETRLTREILSDPDQRQDVESTIPLGRVGAPEDVADVIVFLLGRGSRYVTGAEIAVDGGFLVQ